MRIPILHKLMEGSEKRAVDRAARLLDQGKVELAIEALRAGLARSPRDPNLLLEFTRVLTLGNRLDEAASSLRTLLRAGGDTADRVRELAEMAKLDGLAVGHIHDVLAEHSLRQGDIAKCHEHLEKIDGESRARYAEAHRKRFEVGLRGSQGKPARGALLSGTYVAIAHEAAGNDLAALQVYGRLLGADPEMYPQLGGRLQALAARNYRNASCRLSILDLYLANDDGARAANEATLLIEAAPNLASSLGTRLAEWLGRNPDDRKLRMALARARWAEDRADEAADLMRSLVTSGDADPELAELVSRWRLERPEAGNIALLQAEILGRGGQGAQAVQAISEAIARLPADQMEPALERILARHPGEARAWRLLAELRHSQGNHDAAVEAVAAMRREAPERTGEGAAVLRAVLAARPGHPAAHRLLAKVMLEEGDDAMGVTLLRHLVGLEPQSAGELTEPLEKLAAANPADIPARLGAAEAWMASGHADRALPHLAAAAGAGAEFAAQVAHRLSLLLQGAGDLAAQVAPIIDSLDGKLVDPAAVPFLRAEAARAAGDPKRAASLAGQCHGLAPERSSAPVIGLLERLVHEHPSDSAARMLLSNLLVDRGEALRAVSVVAEAPEPDLGAVSMLLERLEGVLSGRSDPEARAGLARLLLFAGRANEALRTANEALREAGEAAPAMLHLVRAEAQFASGDRGGAVESLRLAPERDPALAGRAMEVLEEIVESESDDSAAGLVLGRLRLDAGQVPEGLALLVELAQADPDHVPESLAAIEAATAREPGDSRLPLAAARLHAAAGSPSAAAEALQVAKTAGATSEEVGAVLEELRQRDPNNPDVLLILGRACAATDPAGACTFLERSAEADPSGAARALALLEEITKTNPGLVAARLSVARIHRVQGEPRAAFDALMPVLAAEPPDADVIELLAELRPKLSTEPEPALAMARAYLSTGRVTDAYREIEAARRAVAAAPDLEPLLDRVVEASGPPGAVLLRAAVRADQGKLDAAVEDLDRAAGEGSAEEACAAAARVLEAHPDHRAARRLHLRLLRAAGDDAAALASLGAAIEATGDRALRCELLVERAELSRALGDEERAGSDLREAEEAAEDRNAFLNRLHVQRARRQQERLEAAAPTERVRLLLDLGRLDEADRLLAASELPNDEARTLRAALLIARGEASAGLQLMRTAPPAALMVDAAQRCDKPALALAALDCLLAEREDVHLRRARERLARDLWRKDLDEARQALVARTPFVPRSETE